MNSDSNRTTKTFTPLNLKCKLETTTPRVRTAFTPITNTYAHKAPSAKNIFMPIEENTTKFTTKLIKKNTLAMNLLFPVRTKTMPIISPTSELNDIVTSNIEKYEMGKILGKGAYAVVKIGVNLLDKEKYAIKSYDKYKLREPHRRRNIRREIQVMKMLDHTNIVKMYEAIKSPKQVHIVQEYFPGFSLGNFMKSRISKRLPESEARIVFKQLLDAIDYMHGLNVCHRDIKLDNILINSKLKIKLIDFGFSTVNELRSKVFCGTPSYMALEIINRKEYLTQPADIWAMGVVLHAILSGSFPFRGITDKDLYHRISEGVKELPDTIPALAKRLIIKMLSPNPLKRPNTKEILRDPWILDHSNHIAQISKLCRSPSTER